MKALHITLLVVLITLSGCVIERKNDEPRIWKCSMRYSGGVDATFIQIPDPRYHGGIDTNGWRHPPNNIGRCRSKPLPPPQPTQEVTP